MTDKLMSLEEIDAALRVGLTPSTTFKIIETVRAAHEWKEKYEAMSKCYAIAGHQALVLQEENSKLREQLSAARREERERCAQLCERIEENLHRAELTQFPELRSDAEDGASECAASIRALGDTE